MNQSRSVPLYLRKLYRGAGVLLLCAGMAVIACFKPAPVPLQPQNSRWIKIDSGGQALSAWQGPWQCVYDTHTKLYWEVKTDAEDLHNQQCSFSWYVANTGEARKGNCFNTPQGADTSRLIDQANALQRCGLNTWRLPSEAELRSLLIDNPRPGEPHIDKSYFPNTRSAPYWSADHDQPLSGHHTRWQKGARAVDFANGKTQTMPYQDATFVRLVRSVVSRKATTQ